jgi:hypothetical protein
MNRLRPPDPRPRVDLLHCARRVFRHRTNGTPLVQLEEEVLGHVRDHDIPGAEIPERYFRFLSCGDGALLNPVLEHNLKRRADEPRTFELTDTRNRKSVDPISNREGLVRACGLLISGAGREEAMLGVRAAGLGLVCLFSVGCVGSDDLAIDRRALEGCRSPAEDGCAVCCTGQGTCARSTGDGGPDQAWYNARGNCAGMGVSCSKSCARCTLRDEEDLRSALNLARDAGCDCGSITIGVDPCYSPVGCPCLCSRIEGGRSRCPPPGLF